MKRKFLITLKNISNSSVRVFLPPEETHQLISSINHGDFIKNPKDNTVLYYPYLELENHKLVTKIDHELFIKTLCLICQRVLLPPSHLIESNISTIVNFRNSLLPLIDAGIIVTSLGKGQSNINAFVENKKEEQKEQWTDNKSLKAEIVSNLFEDDTLLLKRNIKQQSELFYEAIYEGFYGTDHFSFANNPLFSEHDLSLIRKGVDKIQDIKGFKISKNDLDNLTWKLKEDKLLGAKQSNYMYDFATNTYFYGGGRTNQAIVGFSKYFMKTPLKDFLNDSDFGTNLFYDPILLLKTLKEVGIISTFDDIRLLSCHDIIKLRQNDVFRKFAREYKKFSYISYRSYNKTDVENKVVEDILLGKIKQELRLLENIRKSIFEVSKNVISLLCLEHPYNLLTFYPMFFQLGDYNMALSKQIGLEGIIRRTMVNLKPFGLFCSAIDEMIKKNNVVKYI
jgi:hypothetical protein